MKTNITTPTNKPKATRFLGIKTEIATIRIDMPVNIKGWLLSYQLTDTFDLALFIYLTKLAGSVCKILMIRYKT
jgi:hypothetical protein